MDCWEDLRRGRRPELAKPWILTDLVQTGLVLTGRLSMWGLQRPPIVYGIEYMVYGMVCSIGSYMPCVLISPLYWALEPECQILMFTWSFGPTL